MNMLLRVFGIKPNPPVTRPCPTCGSPVKVSPANPYIDRYTEEGLRRAYIAGEIDSEEFIQRMAENTTGRRLSQPAAQL